MKHLLSFSFYFFVFFVLSFLSCFLLGPKVNSIFLGPKRWSLPRGLKSRNQYWPANGFFISIPSILAVNFGNIDHISPDISRYYRVKIAATSKPNTVLPIYRNDI